MDVSPSILLAILAIALLGHGYLWVALVNRLHGWHGNRRLINRLTHLSMVAFVLLPAVVLYALFTAGIGFFLSQTCRYLLILSGYVWTCFFVGLGNLLAALLGGYREDCPTALLKKSRLLLTYDEQPGGRGAYQSRFGRLLGHVPLNESHTLAVDTKRLILPQLPTALSGLRIAHLSDLHVTGSMTPEWYSWVAEQTNAQRPDVIAITGDLIEVENGRDQLVSALQNLRARLGVYFILGNHDLYVDYRRTIDELVAAGLQYVGDRQLELTWNGAEVLLLGNERPWLSHSPKPPSGGPPEQFRFVLMHTPDQFDWAVVHEADLALAGHTHGGQVRLPILGATACPSLYGTRFACGTFRERRTVMHVSRGICGENPLRWRCPPELAILELQSNKGAARRARELRGEIRE